MNISNFAADVMHTKKFKTDKSAKFKLKIPVNFGSMQYIYPS